MKQNCLRRNCIVKAVEIATENCNVTFAYNLLKPEAKN